MPNIDQARSEVWLRVALVGPCKAMRAKLAGETTATGGIGGRPIDLLVAGRVSDIGKGDRQLTASSVVGEARSKSAGGLEDLFPVPQLVAGDKTSAAESETGRTFAWPN